MQSKFFAHVVKAQAGGFSVNWGINDVLLLFTPLRTAVCLRLSLSGSSQQLSSVGLSPLFILFIADLKRDIFCFTGL